MLNIQSPSSKMAKKNFQTIRAPNVSNLVNIEDEAIIINLVFEA